MSDKQLHVNLDRLLGEGTKTILAPYKITGGCPPAPSPQRQTQNPHK